MATDIWHRAPHRVTGEAGKTKGRKYTGQRWGQRATEMTAQETTPQLVQWRYCGYCHQVLDVLAYNAAMGPTHLLSQCMESGGCCGHCYSTRMGLRKPTSFYWLPVQSVAWKSSVESGPHVCTPVGKAVVPTECQVCLTSSQGMLVTPVN